MKFLDLDDFFAGIGVVSATCDLDINTSSDLASGGASRASFGTRYWGGTVSIRTYPHAKADAIKAKIHYLQDADVVFRLYPAHLVSGARVEGTIAGVSSTDRRVVTLDGVQLEDGQYFDVSFSGGKRQLHQVVNMTALAPEISETAAVYTVVPHLPFGAAVGDVVGAGLPEIDASVVRASLGKYEPLIATGFSFQWIQFY